MAFVGWNSQTIQGLIGMIKTLQHSTHLTPYEQQLFTMFVETEDEWFHRLEQAHGLKEARELAQQGYWVDPLEFILPKGISDVQARIALKSMRAGNPTFIDQEVAGKIVDNLFLAARGDGSKLEEEEIYG